MKGLVKCIGIISAFIIVAFACHSPKQPVANRLASASSSYLKEHADNPVQWYEWGDEALAKAATENKPLLISIGYAACHWCHVMEEESFMDTAVARLMNENFICIKIDREERPDLDNLYVHASQLLNNGNSGWPLNAFALPDGKPFFAGTYFAKEQWVSLLNQVASSYKNQYNKVVLQANSITFGMIDNDSLLLTPTTLKAPATRIYETFYDNIAQKIDRVQGGLKGQPKFPVPGVWEFLLQYHYYTGSSQALDLTTLTLTKMALGGLYDQVGGGFARYSTDSVWRVPHFEKMLYDNAQLISLYSHAYQVTQNDFFKTIVLETIGFAERELLDKNGGFYCSVNADTKDGEGAFYSWPAAEFEKIAGKDAALLMQYFNLQKMQSAGKESNILFAKEPPQLFATTHGMGVEQFNTLLMGAKQKLLEWRNKRERPTLDKKILTSWNALMLKAYADAYAAFGNPSFLNRAIANARFLEKNLLQPNGALYRNFMEGKATTPAFLDDYALLAKALIRLYEVTFDKHWLTLAEKLTAYAITAFYDEKSGMFFFASEGETQGKLPVRKMELVNNVLPVSNAAMGQVLYALSTLLDKKAYLNYSTAMLKSIERKLPTFATNAPEWGLLAGLVEKGTHEVAIMGPASIALNTELQRHYLPDCIFMGGLQENLPILTGKMPKTGTLLHVCTQQTCKMPVTTVSAALEQIKGR